MHADEDPLVRPPVVAPIRHAAGPAATTPHAPAIEGVEAPQQLAGGGVERDDVEADGRGVQDPADHDGIDLELGALDSVAGIEGPCEPQLLHVLAVDLSEGRVSDALGSAAVHGPVRAPRPGLRREPRKGEEKQQGVSESHVEVPSQGFDTRTTVGSRGYRPKRLP